MNDDLAGGHRFHGVGAALGKGTGITGASGAGEFVEAFVEDGALGGIDPTVDLNHAVADGFDRDTACASRFPGPAHRLGVDLDDHPVHEFGDPVAGKRVPGWCTLGDLTVDDGQDVRINDQDGALEDQQEDLEVHGTGEEDLGEPG